MQATPHSNNVLPAPEPKDDPLSFCTTPSRAAQRRDEVQRVAAEIVNEAESAGWRVVNERTFSGGCSVYIDLKLTHRIEITLRVSDHSLGRPVGLAGDRPIIVATVGVPGCIDAATRWLAEVAEQVNRIKRGGVCRTSVRGVAKAVMA